MWMLLMVAAAIHTLLRELGCILGLKKQKGNQKP